MKYWVYINDEVSQKAYSEEELKQIEGFGPNVLICSETSAVSSDPEWRPVKERLPYLIKPKAPNFAKFRPKPPVSARPAAPKAEQDIQETLPIPQDLAEGITATPIEQNKKQTQTPQNDVNAQLLATLEKLNDKISSLENKIEEQEKELVEARKADDIEDNSPTLISDPINENDDDVLEVPFDNDFEIPFDTSKNSEEIAKEAEAMLAKPDSVEIEEYNTDDQKTELMSFGSDMQGILEDTIRKNALPEEYNEESTKDRQIIAEDLVSKTVLDLSAKKGQKKEKEFNEKQKEQEKQESKQEEKKEEKAKIVEEEKVYDLNSLLNGEDNPEYNTQENIKEEVVPEQEEKQSEVQEEVQPIQEENSEQEEKQSEVQEEVQPVQEENAEQEEKQSEVQEQEIEELPAVSAEDGVEQNEFSMSVLPEDVKEEDDANIQSELSKSIKPEEENIEKQEVEENQEQGNDDETPITIEMPENTESANQEEINFEKHNDEFPKYEEEIVSEENKETEEVPQEEIKEEMPSVSEDFRNLEPLLGDTQNAEEEEKLTIKPEEDVSPTQEIEINQLQEPVKEEEATPVKEALMAKLPEDNATTEEKPDLALTMGVTISKDATTAAVLDEIAQEKSLEEVQQDSQNLFEEMEGLQEDNTEKVNTEETTNKISAEKSDSTEESKTSVSDTEQKTESREVSNNISPTDIKTSDETIANDDFLKTFATNVEEVFLDQPTAIISDYVPPTENTDKEDMVSLENIKRVKPSDIKTIPLVPEVVGEEIHSSPYVESATTNVGKANKIKIALYLFVLFVGFLIAVVAVLMIAAFFGVVPEKYSPIHKIVNRRQVIQEEQSNAIVQTMQPEVMDQERTVLTDQPIFETEPAVDSMSEILTQVKQYSFPNNTTLEQRIIAANNVEGNLDWSISPTEDLDVYSIAVKLPANMEGQSFSYRFNYNVNGGVLTPTTSESKNIMENYK